MFTWPAKTPFNLLNRLHDWRRTEFVQTLEHIADMLTAGIDLISTFSELSRSGNQREREFGARALRQLEAGQPLIDILVPYVEPAVVQIFTVAERVGALPQALADHVERTRSRQRWRQQVGRTLTYPALLLVSCYVLAIFVRLRIDPELQHLQDELYRGLSQQSGGGNRLANNLSLCLLVTMTCMPLLYGGLRVVRRLTNGNLRLRLPFDDLLQCIASERFVYSLHVQLAAGMPLVDALHALANTSHHAAARYEELEAAILAGQRFSTALPQDLHPIVAQLVQIGETTGDLVTAFARASRFLQTRSARQLQRLATWLEPGLMALMGSVVASAMYSVFGPMY